MKIEFILIGVIVLVFLIDFIVKKRKNYNQKIGKDIINLDKSKPNKFRWFLKKVFLFVIILSFIASGYYLYLTKPKPLGSNALSCIITEVPNSKLETSSVFEVIYLPSHTPIFLDNSKKEDHIVLTFEGLQKKFNEKDKLSFGTISANDLKRFFNESSNNFLIPVKLIGKTELATYLFEKFGDGFWSKEVNLEIINNDNFNFPKIKNIKIEGGVTISQDNYNFNDEEFNIGNTFDYTDLRHKEISTTNIKKQKIDVELEGIVDNSKYFISIFDKKNFKEDSNEESKEFFLKKLNSEYISRTNIINSNNTSRLSRTLDWSDEHLEILVFLTILKNNRYYFKLIGKSKNDQLGPKIRLDGYSLNSNYNSNSDESEIISINAKRWSGWERPYEIEIYGKIDRLYIGGNRININKSKSYQKIFKVLSINVNLGYYRIPVIAYVIFGNRSESYLDGEAVSGD